MPTPQLSLILAIILFCPWLDAEDGFPVLDVTCSWIGNSFPHGGSTEVPPAWVPQDVAGIAVAADGTVYTNVFWEEGGANQTAMRDGVITGVARGSHGWGHQGGSEVAVDDEFLFFTQRFDNEGGGLKDPEQWPPKGSFWWGVSRRSRSDISKGPPFQGGKGGKESPKACFLPIHETDKNASLTGLCAHAGELFVSSAYDDCIRVFDTTTMQEKRRIPCTDPARLTVHNQTLWVITDRGRALRCFDLTGAEIAEPFILPAGMQANGIVSDGNTQLYIADGGPSAQIFVYRINGTSATLTRRIGQPEGILAGPIPGRFGDLRFHAIAGIGLDSDQNIYVASTQKPSSGSIIESYTAKDAIRWRLFGLEFVDRIAEDPSDHNSLFSKETHYRLDWSKPPGQEWSYHALTLDASRFPYDPRTFGMLSPSVCRLNGQRFLILTGQNGSGTIGVIRFDEATHGDIGIPCALITDRPTKRFPDEPQGGYMWVDHNGDGQPEASEYTVLDGKGPGAEGMYVDETGTLWLAGKTLHRLSYLGLNEHGVPKWDLVNFTSFPPPAPFTAVKRVRYLADSDTLILAGINDEHRNQHWKPMGPVLARYDNWMRKSNRTPSWSTVATYDQGRKGQHISCEPISFDVAGDFIFISICGPSKDLGINWGTVEVRRLSDGSLVGHMQPDAQIGKVGLMDMVECIHAFQRDDGEYIVLLEDDRCAKNIMYRWKPKQ